MLMQLLGWFIVLLADGPETTGWVMTPPTKSGEGDGSRRKNSSLDRFWTSALLPKEAHAGKDLEAATMKAGLSLSLLFCHSCIQATQSAIKVF